ncbi:uncharacterized protein LOC113519307 isoform X2 [Galleria mellonella]|uniref:Uncharacterized protein LOC113519307 isoform X2 n=1 Tax=Galleria mellonella TaxID=7137 RepID=A0ABM3M8L8_GALME|nr:uncharacterized protein LOC113519307 isoform X2 [Galleria mellonella]
MIMYLIVIFLLGATAQRYPSFFDNDDLKEMGFMSHARNPNPIVHQHKEPHPTTISRRPSEDVEFRPPPRNHKIKLAQQAYAHGQEYGGPVGNVENSVLDEYESILDKSGKWDEFIRETDRLKEKYKGKVMPNWKEDVQRWKVSFILYINFR